ncbi:alpha/beta-hydrolase [Mycena vitilis]|nr:alpha/beta-hydrolase [Mycena vitilis]
MVPLLVENFIIPGAPEDDLLKTCAKRYTPAHLPERKRSVALMFTPNIGAHCETWQTAIEKLFDIQQADSRGTDLVISEAWALEYPNHGRAAIINDHALLKRPQGADGQVCARAVLRFMNSGLVKADALIPVGYSASTCVMILTTSGMDLNKLPYPMMILVEPPMMTREVMAKASKLTGPRSPHAQLEMVMTAVGSKRDIWPTREDARQWMSRRPPWNNWKAEVLDHFVEFALRDLPTAAYPETKRGVTLCCTRQQEVTAYTHFHDAIDGVARLTELCAVLPVHCIFGAKNDLIAAETQKALIDPASGRKMASITRIPGAGHLVVQEEPHKLAERIYAIVNPYKPSKL